MLEFVEAWRCKREIKRLYCTAFPKEERAPLFFLYRKARKGQADFCAVLDGEKFVGMTFLGGTDRVVTLMYLAIDELQRGKGYGGRILDAVKKANSGKKLCLNIELLDRTAGNYAQRVKRKAFYQRNGFESLNYTVREGGVVYEMLSFGGFVTQEEYRGMMETLFGKVLYTVLKKW